MVRPQPVPDQDGPATTRTGPGWSGHNHFFHGYVGFKGRIRKSEVSDQVNDQGGASITQARRYAVIPGNRVTIRVYEYGRPAGGSVIRTRTRTRTRKSAMVFWGTPPTWGQTHRQFWYLS